MGGNYKWYAADFETAADNQALKNKRTYVWAWGIQEVKKERPNFYYGTDILSFIAKTLELGGGTFWFHNEKFDGSFILSFLLKNGFQLDERPTFEMDDYTYNIIMSNMGQIYLIEFKVNNVVVKIQNSLLKIPGKIKDIAKSLKLDVSKGEIDYHKYRKEGGELTEEDLDYLKRDVDILSKALYSMHLQNGNNAMTIGADCMKKYKEMQNKFDNLFPKLSYKIDNFIRKSYRGGYVYTKYKNYYVKDGATYDKNSMYPGVMHSDSKYLFPYGIPKYFKGEYEEDKKYNLYVQRLIVTAKLKTNRWPTINLGCGFSKSGHSEYAEIIDNQELTLTDVDLLWLFKNYDIESIYFIDGYKFKSCRGTFDDYINNYMELKEYATKIKDPIKRQLAKLMLNNLYGKFGTNPIRHSKIPILENGIIKYKDKKQYYLDKYKEQGKICLEKFYEYNQTGYIPVATFCTAYARNELWKAMEVIWEYFLYCDTDSIHILKDGIEIAKKKLKIHKTKLGLWAKESEWDEAIFLRAKTYSEHIIEKDEKPVEEPYWDIKACGMPEEIKNQIDIKDFQVGHSWCTLKYLNSLSYEDLVKLKRKTKIHIIDKEGKLAPKQVEGGIILDDTIFTITE